MLPQSNINKLNNKTIYINPNFKGQLPGDTGVKIHSTSVIPKNAHINPLFLEAHTQGHTIHMNPAFLQKFGEDQQLQQEKHIFLKNVPGNISGDLLVDDKLDEKVPAINLKATDVGKIICRSKNRIIREPVDKSMIQTPSLSKSAIPLPPFLVLNKRKLIRKVPSVPVIAGTEKFQNCDNSNTRTTKYSLDNRMLRRKALFPPTPKIKRTSFVAQYALKRTSLSFLSSISTKRSLAVNKNINNKIEVLNINGLLYKSTRNSLKLKDVTLKGHINATQNTSNDIKSNQKCSLKGSLKSNQGLTIFVRGIKYVMDANKFKLIRVTNTDHSLSNADRNKREIDATCKRIDIGGYTYVSVNSAKTILIRTTNHLSRAYVHNAKQKSLQLLMKRLVKTNIPCPIYQYIGKCAAFERGKCSKVHNKLQVAICSKFLRGECLNSNCLLSHNVSLSKMPVCKFFLQGVCVRNDCPYLHKKLSNQAELCTDFVRGFCELADKCNKRHEFVCPEIEKNITCTTKNCIYCTAKRRKELQAEKKAEKSINNNNINSKPPNLPSTANAIEAKENISCKRYFIESCDGARKTYDEYDEMYTNEDDRDKNDCTIENFVENFENSRIRRPKLGALPAYIPL